MPQPSTANPVSIHLKTTALWILVLLFIPLLAAAQSPPASLQRTEQRAPCRDYDPLRKPLFGETHSHTAYSFDAVSLGTVNRPRDAYRYAQGGAVYVADAAGNPTICAQQPRPVDFAVVTDHSEFFGELHICTTRGTPGYDSPQCQLYRKSAMAVQRQVPPAWRGASQSRRRRQRTFSQAGPSPGLRSWPGTTGRCASQAARMARTASIASPAWSEVGAWRPGFFPVRRPGGLIVEDHAAEDPNLRMQDLRVLPRVWLCCSRF